MSESILSSERGRMEEHMGMPACAEVISKQREHTLK
jgi:hypothetical protein